MHDTPDNDPPDAPASATPHPLERAHRFFLKAAPVIREVNDTIERHGGLEHVRDAVVERAGEFVRKADEAVANATAIEGDVVECDEPAATAVPLATPQEQPHRSPLRWIALAMVAAAATYGALRLQRR